MKYPFTPKSTALLRAGQFWAIPLRSGRFACGRVLQVGASAIPTKMRAFFGGLHDWIGNAPPDAQTIAESRLIAFGVMHIKAIVSTGGNVLGEVPLRSDAIPLMLDAQGGPATMLMRGAEPLRQARKGEWCEHPVIEYWGHDVVQIVAERLERER